jgi:hypothetical protein
LTWAQEMLDVINLWLPLVCVFLTTHWFFNQGTKKGISDVHRYKLDLICILLSNPALLENSDLQNLA